MVDDGDSLSDVNKTIEPEMEEEKLETLGMGSAEKFDSISELGDSSQSVGGVRDETASLEGAEGDTEFIVEAAAEMNELPVVAAEDLAAAAEQGGGRLIASQSEDSQLDEMKPEEEANGVDDAEQEVVVTDTVELKVDESIVEPKLEMEVVEEFAQAVDTKKERAVSDSEAQIDGGDDVMPLDPQLETEAGQEPTQIVETETEVVPTDVGDTQQLPELQMEALDDESEVQMGDGECNEAEAVVEGDKVNEEKVDAVVNDSEVGITEKIVGVEEEKVDTVITEVETDEQMITEVNACEVDIGEQEVKDVVAEDESTSMEVLGGPTLDEPVNVTGNIEIEDDVQEGDIEAETETGVELELPENDVAEDVELADTEFVTEEGTEAVADKSGDEDEKMETEETNSDEADEVGPDLYDSPAALEDDEDEAMAAEEEAGTETDIAESGKTSGGKRKRGKLSKSPSISKSTPRSRKTVGEDVCFICFDGGELVLCDRRGCPKAYHPACVNRDEAFFRSKGRWNCGWHLCSICEKNARYMCYTCTYSLCKSCTKDAVILSVRGNKGFCETCIRTVKLIENNEQGDNDTQVDFDDKSSWEFLFKDYYIELKAKLSLSSDEIAEAKNPWKGADTSGPSKQESDANDGGSGSDDSTENLETIRPKRRKVRRQSKRLSRGDESASTGKKAVSAPDNTEWASKELLEFVSHMNDGDTSYLSQFDVQALLLEYIKRNKLRDPRRKSQIICDARLENLFGKPRVGHFEMLKLLESHFLVRDEQNDDVQGSVVDTENNQLDTDGNADPNRGVKDKKRKSRKKNVGRQSNLEDYAAIDMHNIGLIYLRRKLMEDLLEDAELFHDKVIGTFVRIRISGSNQKQDLYRLVPVVGTSVAAEPYKIGKKSTDTVVEILNLDKTEIISIDTISNQEFTEEECKRLRQSIKCGLIRRMTVGDILDKTMEIQTARVNDWLESEVLRLSHLRDRASDLGRRKEYPFLPFEECVEKLQLLKTPEERRRRLDEIPEIHADPKMDPSYESDDNDSENEESRRDAFMRSKGFSRRVRGPSTISPGSDNSAKVNSNNWESSKYLSGSSSFSINASHVGEIVNENAWNLDRDKETEESSNFDKRTGTNTEFCERTPQPVSRSESFPGATSIVTSQSSFSPGIVETAVKINESDKIWHYKDPSGKVQGPFSMVQLRKWNNTGYFPADLKIWKSTETHDTSVLLADALEGKFPKESPAVKNIFPASHSGKMSENSGSHSNLSSEKWRGGEFTNLPSPTPKQSSNSGWNAEERGVLTGAIHQTPGGVNGLLSSPTPTLPNIGTHSLNPVVQTTPFSPTPNSQQVQTHARQQPVQAVISQNLGPQSGQQAQGYGWGTANVQNSPGSFSNTGTPTGLQPDAWRPAQASQPNNMPPPATANATWGMWPTENNTPVGARPENTNSGWGPLPSNPNMGGGNIPPGNSTNMNWGPPPMPVPMPGNASNWVAPGNTGANMPGYANPGWGAPPVQGPVGGNGWGPPSGNGPPLGNNTNQGFGPSGNQGGSWGGGGEPNHMGGQFSGPRGGQGRDSGYSGGPRPWNRQSSFGGGGFRKCDMACPYNKNGRCRKGAHCDYLHN
ncbi:zinc finger CCCH domain-containing protein 19 [Phtheirospermum japonicum]|uniref:Zinc finger CCCH domain-containing protein 19 n=1 Tax=Phtheirospermum japonicum TaxID=374723 RepID=A0A830BNX2_9LAMI|nr:zinc finger CCCH domain-containing protein 19 [Phtheirospermum japonicum]